jgi:3-oxoacyl-(acyl-carrier-protein) synthase
MTAPRAVITGLGAVSALGRGAQAQLAGALAGTAAFGPVRRFDVAGRRVTDAATLADAGTLAGELAGVVEEACQGLSAADRTETQLLLGIHGHPGAGRDDSATTAGFAAELARRAGLAGVARLYTCACVSGSTAVADAAAQVRSGRSGRVVVAAGYLVETDQFALFEAGRALAQDGAARPFSGCRSGLLLGDAVAAVVLESAGAREELAEVAGWGRAGDAHHVVRPDPEGTGMVRAIEAALRRGGIGPDEVGYVNANASGAPGDSAEAVALKQVFGARRPPVSATKSVHGHGLEGSGLLELVITVLAAQAGKLPMNLGHRTPDPACDLDLVLDGPRNATSPYALTVNAAFGGANTALLVRSP